LENKTFTFYIFLFTSFFVYLLGSIILLDIKLFFESLPIFFVTIGLISLIFVFSNYFSSALYSIVFVFFLLFIVSFFNFKITQYLFFCVFAIAIYSISRSTRLPLNQIKSILLLSIASSFLIIGLDSYTEFNLIKKISSGMIQKDSLFHISIASMLKNYGIPSTGLNGLIPINYHTFSHRLFASISILSGKSVLLSYSYFTWIFLAPLFIYSILLVVIEFNIRTFYSYKNIIIAYFILFVILFFVPHFLSKWNLWNSYFNSESYLVANIIMLCGLPFLMKPNVDSKQVVFLLLILFLLSQSKISNGFIYLSILIFYLLFVQKNKLHVKLAQSLIAGLIFIFASGITKENSSPIEFEYFHFVNLYSEGYENYLKICNSFTWTRFNLFIKNGLLIIGFFEFLFFHFILTWVILLLRYSSQKNIFNYLKEEYVFLIPLIISLIIIFILKIPGGSVYYFTNICFIISTPYTILYLINLLETYFTNSSKRFVKYRWLLLTGGVFTYFSLSFNIYIRKSYLCKIENSQNVLVQHLLNLRYDSNLDSIYTSNHKIDSSNPLMDCSAKPFIYPAISERVWKNVMLDEKCELVNYGYEVYFK
jgi:hypothetical protein